MLPGKRVPASLSAYYKLDIKNIPKHRKGLTVEGRFSWLSRQETAAKLASGFYITCLQFFIPIADGVEFGDLGE
jgi:hypothetical protein